MSISDAYHTTLMDSKNRIIEKQDKRISALTDDVEKLREANKTLSGRDLGFRKRITNLENEIKHWRAWCLGELPSPPVFKLGERA